MAVQESRRVERRALVTPSLSPVEAAFVTELPRKTVEQAIDRGEVTPVPARRRGRPRPAPWREREPRRVFDAGDPPALASSGRTSARPQPRAEPKEEYPLATVGG